MANPGGQLAPLASFYMCGGLAAAGKPPSDRLNLSLDSPPAPPIIVPARGGLDLRCVSVATLELTGAAYVASFPPFGRRLRRG